jgi:hypothetical protein
MLFVKIIFTWCAGDFGGKEGVGWRRLQQGQKQRKQRKNNAIP